MNPVQGQSNSALPNSTTHGGTLDGQNDTRTNGGVPMYGTADVFSQGLGLRTQSLPVLDNFVSRIHSTRRTLLTLTGNANTERDCQVLLPRNTEYDGCIANWCRTAMVLAGYAVHRNKKGLYQRVPFSVGSESRVVQERSD